MENQFIYSKNVIELVTVVAESCLLLENCTQISKEEFIQKTIKILPLLYLKTTLVEMDETDDDSSERFVNEDDYLYIKQQVETLLGADDAFLEVFHPDMPYSDTPIASFISENIADIYQELKDFAANYQLGETYIMESALYNFLQSFAEHWGQKLLNVLRALHAIRYSERFGVEEDNASLNTNEYRKIDRNSFLRFQTDDDDNEI